MRTAEWLCDSFAVIARDEVPKQSLRLLRIREVKRNNGIG